jgi:hypothetical protein
VEANLYEDNWLYMTFTFSHDKGKISKVLLTFPNDDVFSASRKSGELSLHANRLLQFVLPQPIHGKAVESGFSAKKRKDNDSYSETYKLTWDGDNVAKYIIEYADGTEIEITEIDCEYDKYLNPYHRNLSESVYYMQPELYSKNNLTKATYYDVGSKPSIETYSYKYDGKYPTEKTSTYSYSYPVWSGGEIRVTNTSTYYYEYE